MAHLDSLAGDFGRPVSVSRAALGAAEMKQRHLSEPAADQNLCAAILVLEKGGLHDRRFQELAAVCMRRVTTTPGFRLLVYLHDITISELRESADKEWLADLFDTTQIPDLPSLDDLTRTLVPFVRRVERIRAAAAWRTVRLKAAIIFSQLAAVGLWVTAGVALLGFPVWLLGWNLSCLGRGGPILASLILGVAAFPIQAPLIFFLLRGMRTTMLAPRENAFLRRWVVIGGVVLFGANHFQYGLHGPYSWVILGAALGVVLDAISRAGPQARRQAIDIASLRRRATDIALEDAALTVLRGDPLNPYSCPLLPSPSARVFISYARKSEKGTKVAASLYQQLKGTGASPYLDRTSNPTGASWRGSLNQHLGECDAFVCILDEQSAQRKWVAAELLAAIEAHRLAAVPEVIVLIDPAVNRRSQNVLPLFRGVIAAADEPPTHGRTQFIELNEEACTAVAWALSPKRLVCTSVFPPGPASLVQFAMMLIAIVGAFGVFAGFILGFLAMIEKAGNFPLTSGLAAVGWLEPITLLTALWFGYTCRAAIAWRYERESVSDIGTAIPTIAVCGLIGAGAVFAPNVSILVLGWSIVLALVGWMIVSWIAPKRLG
jgi:hypothetical protein